MWAASEFASYWQTTTSSRGGKKMWCVPEITTEYVQRMENVLRLYARPHNPSTPVVCFDERPVQLHEDARLGTSAKPGAGAKYDYEYIRRGTANVFCIVEPTTGARMTHATKNRKNPAFAKAMTKIARRYSRAKLIHVVLDNLSSHSEKALTDTLGAQKGHALFKRFKFHFTPKHASWLNAAEIEAGLVSRECLGNRRLATLKRLRTEVRAWSKRAARDGRTIDWKFTVNDARRVFRYDGIATLGSEH